MIDKKRILYWILGGYLFLLGIFGIVNAILISPETANPLWICYSSLILIGAGFFLRNSYLILSQLNIIFVPLIFWNIDFFYKAFTKSSLWGITDYFFMGNFGLGSFITLQHVYILPLAILGVYFLKLKRNRAWVISLIQISLIFFFSFFFTLPEKNTNCVFESCFSPISISSPGYYFAWFVAFGIMIFGTNYLFYYFLKDRK